MAAGWRNEDLAVDMAVGVCTVWLRLNESGSLKDKRRVVRSLIERVQARYNVSVAEIALQDDWQHAVIGASCVSGDEAVVQQVLEAVVRLMEGHAACDVTRHRIELY